MVAGVVCKGEPPAMALLEGGEHAPHAQSTEHPRPHHTAAKPPWAQSSTTLQSPARSKAQLTTHRPPLQSTADEHHPHSHAKQNSPAQSTASNDTAHVDGAEHGL